MFSNNSLRDGIPLFLSSYRRFSRVAGIFPTFFFSVYNNAITIYARPFFALLVYPTLRILKFFSSSCHPVSYREFLVADSLRTVNLTASQRSDNCTRHLAM